MIEEWKAIKGYEDYYISNLGRIKSINSYNNKDREEKTLIPTDNGNGYKLIRLCKKGKKQNKYIHRLVAEAFIPNPLNYKEVNHIDNNKANNNVNNLEWCTRSYNVKYSYRKGKHIPTKNMLGRKGANHPISKPIMQYDLNGNLIREYESANLASQITGICYGSIKKCRNRKVKTAGGFIWRYSNENYS